MWCDSDMLLITDSDKHKLDQVDRESYLSEIKVGRFLVPQFFILFNYAPNLSDNW